MVLRNPVPKISLIIMAAAAVYLFLISGQERMADGGLSGEEMYLPEKIFSLAPSISVFATWGVGLWRAYKSGSRFWLLLQFFLFPASYVYTLFVNHGEEPRNSSTPNLLRGSE